MDDPIFASLTDLFNEEKARNDAQEDQREGFDGRGETMEHDGLCRACLDYRDNKYLCPLHEAAPRCLKALKDLLDRHVSLIESGDCGSWDAYGEPAVREAASTINQVERRQ